MATSADKFLCVTCGKEKVAHKCEGCSEHFCFNHMVDHHQSLIKQLDQTEDKRNLFQQILIEQTYNPEKQLLIQQINQWEKNSIDKIHQVGDETRQLVIEHTREHFNQMQIKLTKLTEELRQVRQEERINEIHLNRFEEKLKELTQQLNQPANISIEQDNSSSFINKLFLFIHHEQPFLPNISTNQKWRQNGLTVAGGNGRGNGLNQLSSPWSVCVDDDQTIYVADYCNHRIVEWKKGATSGQVVADGRGQGDRNDQLNHPVKVIVDKKNDALIICDRGNQRVVRWPRRNGTNGETVISNVDCWGLSMNNDGYLYVSDGRKHEVRRWKIGETNGTLVAGGYGKGNRLDQLNQPLNIFVDHDQSVYVSDFGNHRVMKWVKGAREGIVVAGGQGQGNGLTQLAGPRGIVVDHLGNIYIADGGNHRVMRWLEGAREGNVVVDGNGQGVQANQLSNPLDLSFDGENNLYLADYGNHRVQKFTMKPNATSYNG